MKFWLPSVLVLIALGTSQMSRAAEKLSGSLGLFYFSETNDSTTSGSEDSTKVTTAYTFYDVGFCYQIDSICLGAKYFAGTKDTKTTSSSSAITSKADTKYSGLGVKIGYAGEGLVATYALIASGKREKGAAIGSTASGDEVYPMSSAQTIDVGYGFKISNVRFGPMLSLHHFEYKKVEQGGTRSDLPQKQTDEFTMPYLALWLDF